MAGTRKERRGTCKIYRHPISKKCIYHRCKSGKRYPYSGKCIRSISKSRKRKTQNLLASFFRSSRRRSAFRRFGSLARKSSSPKLRRTGRVRKAAQRYSP